MLAALYRKAQSRSAILALSVSCPSYVLYLAEVILEKLSDRAKNKAKIAVFSAAGGNVP